MVYLSEPDISQGSSQVFNFMASNNLIDIIKIWENIFQFDFVSGEKKNLLSVYYKIPKDQNYQPCIQLLYF